MKRDQGIPNRSNLCRTKIAYQSPNLRLGRPLNLMLSSTFHGTKPENVNGVQSTLVHSTRPLPTSDRETTPIDWIRSKQANHALRLQVDIYVVESGTRRKTGDCVDISAEEVDEASAYRCPHVPDEHLPSQRRAKAGRRSQTNDG